MSTAVKPAPRNVDRRQPDLPTDTIVAWLRRAAERVRAGESMTTAVSESAPAEATVHYEGGGATHYYGIAYDAVENHARDLGILLGEWPINEMTGKPWFPAITEWFEDLQEDGELAPLIDDTADALEAPPAADPLPEFLSQVARMDGETVSRAMAATADAWGRWWWREIDPAYSRAVDAVGEDDAGLGEALAATHAAVATAPGGGPTGPLLGLARRAAVGLVARRRIRPVDYDRMTSGLRVVGITVHPDDPDPLR